MLGILSQTSLILTVVFSFAICLVMFKSSLSSQSIGKVWIAFNAFVGFWAALWWGGAFLATTAAGQWRFMYLANLLAIALPPLFVSFVRLYLGKTVYSSRLVWVACGVSSILIIASVLSPTQFVSGMQKISIAYVPVAGLLLWAFAAQYTLLIFAGTILLIQEYPRQSIAQRNKTLYILCGCLVGFLGGATTFPPALGIARFYPYGIVLVPVYSLFITYAILKHRLMDITIIIRKTLVYSVVMGSLAVAYMLIVGAFAHVFEGLTGYQTIFSSAVAAGLMTMLFHPLRKKVQPIVDAKFFRQHVDREEKLYELSRDVVTHTSPEAMATALRNVLNETFHPKMGALYLRARDNPGFAPVTRWGVSQFPSLSEDHPLLKYFKDHPQPFVLDEPSETGAPQSTRNAASQRRDA